jgi:hypothetical protein
MSVFIKITFFDVIIIFKLLLWHRENSFIFYHYILFRHESTFCLNQEVKIIMHDEQIGSAY